MTEQDIREISRTLLLSSAPNWPPEAAKVLDRIEQSLRAQDSACLNADQRQALTNARIQLTEARRVLASAGDALIATLVGEAIYRAAWAMELAYTPWALDRYAGILARRKGGRVRGVEIAKVAKKQDAMITKYLKRWNVSDELQDQYPGPATYIKKKTGLNSRTIQRRLGILARQ